MRVLILTQYFPPEVGAAQGRLAALARELRGHGDEVTVVTALPNYPGGRIYPKYAGRLYLRDDWDGFPVYRTWLYPSLGTGLRRLFNYASFAVTSLWGLSRAGRPDLLFVESPPMSLGIPGIMAARAWGVPLVFNVADLWPDAIRAVGALGDGVALRLAGRLERFLYRQATYVNAVTRHWQRTLIEERGVPAEKVLFLPNGVDTTRYRPTEPDRALRSRLGLEGKQVVVYAGTHGYAHAVDIALRAARLLTGHPAIHFVFVGDGSQKPELVRLARDLALRNVTFLDPVPPDEVGRFLSIAACGLVTLRGSAYFEAVRPVKTWAILACGRATVFSGAGEGADLVREADAGIVVPPEDPAALAAAIREVCADPARAEAYGRRGRRYAEEHLDWARVVGAWGADLRAREARRLGLATTGAR